ncbi:hypothetical protein [Iodidimonas sp. SYSU 1G8]|uniref:hypothetical protein n=1 Tax=Iodidimonas sp. SYSU 1G8 TaxID=3133967 RepID=UPI0031FE53B6
MARRRRRSGTASRRILIASTLLFAASVVAFVAMKTDIGETVLQRAKALFPGKEASCCGADVVLTEFQVPVLAHVVNDLWRDGRARDIPLPPRLATPAQAVNVSLISQGRVVQQVWLREGTVMDALTAALTQFRSQLSAEQKAGIDGVELFLGHSFRTVDLEDYDEQVFAQHHRGIRGLEISYEDRTALYSPLMLLRRNRSASRLADEFAADSKIDRASLLRHGVFKIFDGEQIRVTLGSNPSAVLMERGNVYVKVTDIDAAAVRRAAALATDWLAANVAIDGALPYGYRPSDLKPLEGSNRIRQWMATIALQRAAQPRLDPEIWELAERNLAYNIATTYRQEGALGVITTENNQVSLGSVALAALAIHESHVGGRHAAEQAALGATIDSLHGENGAFRTFLRPATRNDNQNFYPGEALLYWASLEAKQPDPQRLERFMQSFRHYRDRYRAKRNPAFIGWHSQADYTMWQVTRAPELRDFVFEMNDWLISLQQWAVPTEYRDLMGRFYAPGAGYGPPHASSNGIYLEGLVDAFALARETGDTKRAEAYRIAILRGLRSVLQLQFSDDTDMFYVPPGFRRYVRGGIRTTEYDNVIRIDNVQHNLMAMLKILQVFKPADYRYPDASAPTPQPKP